ncbi:MAG: efflux RND transporter periplasmic adaptor subunit [Eubacteriales bacterium]|nr:efflux RND transporter periplasmic adaptor subunit [Eubacteriales bacterium]
MKGKKKKTGLIITLAVAVVVVAGAAVGVSLFLKQKAAASQTTYSTVTIGTGDLEKSIEGTGSLSYAQAKDLRYDFDVTLQSIEVSAGQSVSQGDVLAKVDTTALGDTITTLKQKVSSLDSSIARQKKSESDTETVKAPAAGRVKAIYAQSGSTTQSVMDANGALALLSVDGKMTVTLENTSLTAGQSVTVTDGTNTYDGLVEKVSAGGAVVTFSDETIAVGADVTVSVDGAAVGSAQAQVNMPVTVSGTDGTLSKVYVSENDSVSTSSSLFYIIDKPSSAALQTLVQQRAQAAQALTQVQELYRSGQITAQADGIISQINAKEDETVMSGSAWISVYDQSQMQMVVSVDELDINNVTVGQEARVVLDALEDQTITATVTDISQVGSASGGVTTYSVTLLVDVSEGMKQGMNGTATILVEQRNGVVLVPIQALQISKDGQYVWLSGQGSDGEPGIKTAVTTGLSNDSYAEVLTGLSAGDKVVIVRTATASNDMSNMFSGMGGMGGMTGAMPSGDMPSGAMPGGGSMPSGDRGSGQASGGSR